MLWLEKLFPTKKIHPSKVASKRTSKLFFTFLRATKFLPNNQTITYNFDRSTYSQKYLSGNFAKKEYLNIFKARNLHNCFVFCTKKYTHVSFSLKLVKTSNFENCNY